MERQVQSESERYELEATSRTLHGRRRVVADVSVRLASRVWELGRIWKNVAGVAFVFAFIEYFRRAGNGVADISSWPFFWLLLE